MKKEDKAGWLTLSGLIVIAIFYFTSELSLTFSTTLMIIGMGSIGILASMYQKDVKCVEDES